MIRNYKTLGVAIAAMLALSAFVAQGASAKPLTLEGENIGASIFTTGDQDGGLTKFTSVAHGGNVSCTEVHYLGAGAVASLAVNHQSVVPSYPTLTKAGANNCSAFGFPTHVINHGCQFTFTTPTSIGVGQVTWSGASQVHQTCSAGSAITITPTFGGVSVCTQTIGEQTPTGGHVVGKNITHNGKMAVTLEITVTGIHFIGNGGVCGPNGVTTTDGTLTGNSTVTCFSDAAREKQIGCTFS